ncbi:hypothetical protein BH09PSE1_BH09PSE1_01550 [soil metagenome]
MARFTTRSTYLGWLGRAMRPVGQTPASGAGVEGEDLVLGYATGYGRDQVEAFVRSLRAVYDGPVALFVTADAELASFFAEHRIEALAATADGQWTPTPVVARFADYAAQVAALPGVRDVLLTDVRDVVFQGAPFEPRAAGLEVFIEDEQHRLADHDFQIKYLLALVGADLTEAVKTYPSLCAGVILGPAAQVGQLCRLIITLGAIPRSSVGGGFGVDQASLNVAVHYGLIDAIVRDNFGRVATIGMSPEGVSASDGRIVNRDGSVSPVVHQYDRLPELMDMVRGRWGGEMPDRTKAGPRGLAKWWNRVRTSAVRRLPDRR